MDEERLAEFIRLWFEQNIAYSNWSCADKDEPDALEGTCNLNDLAHDIIELMEEKS